MLFTLCYAKLVTLSFQPISDDTSKSFFKSKPDKTEEASSEIGHVDHKTHHEDHSREETSEESTHHPHHNTADDGDESKGEGSFACDDSGMCFPSEGSGTGLNPMDETLQSFGSGADADAEEEEDCMQFSRPVCPEGAKICLEGDRCPIPVCCFDDQEMPSHHHHSHH